jgi:nitrite reductase (NADH) small subunit
MSSLIDIEIEEAPTQTAQQWVDICTTDDLVENSGICAVLPHHKDDTSEGSFTQIALFYLPINEQVFVLSNFDPIGEANVMYRGIIGSINDEPMVSSPLYKQHFSLTTGQCFEQQDISLKVYPCRINEGVVQITLTPVSGDGQ